MSDDAIQVQGLGKKYRIGNHAPYARFTELLIGAAKAPFNLAKQKLAAPATSQNTTHSSEFWALQDVNFNIKQGEIVGVIGRNGAGKSTLLKLLSRITEPTTGRIRYKGRVGSLLEVGTGFHPELTGRDNIYLNGAILGMTRAEVRRKFDEIVAFSEVEKFLDTAVKHYSSGMYMRLAFAVAAHLEPEILLVDEVLAVGDAEFQKKCLGKMGEVAKGGRTILFVSHNMGAIQQLCERCIYISKGRVEYDGQVDEAMQRYNANVQRARTELTQDLRNWGQRYGSGEVKLTSARLVNEAGVAVHSIACDETFTIKLDIESKKPAICIFSALCKTDREIGAIHISQFDDAAAAAVQIDGRYEVSFEIVKNQLMPGMFLWDLGIHSPNYIPIDVATDTLSFTVTEALHSTRPFTTTNHAACCRATVSFQIEKVLQT